MKYKSISFIQKGYLINTNFMVYDRNVIDFFMAIEF